MEPLANEYDKHSIFVCNEAKDSLVKFSVRSKIPEHGLTVFDMGCGSGKVTKTILLEAVLKYKLKKIIAVDNNTEMIEYAKANYDDIKIEFKTYDMNSHELPNEWVGNFDVVFGFHSLHWMKESISLRNINKLLKPNGEILTKFLYRHPYGFAQLKVIKEEKWRKYFEKEAPNIPGMEYRSIDDFISAFQKNGFIVRNAEMRHVKFELKNEWETKEIFRQVNSCKNYIPNNLWEEFLESVFEEYKAHILDLKEFEVKDPRRVICISSLLIDARKCI